MANVYVRIPISDEIADLSTLTHLLALFSVFGLGSGLGKVFALLSRFGPLIIQGGPFGGWINDTLGWYVHLAAFSHSKI